MADPEIVKDNVPETIASPTENPNPNDNINPFAGDVDNTPDITPEPTPEPQPEPEVIDDSEPDKKIVRKPAQLIHAHDEFVNQKSDRLVRLFHADIKKYLDDNTKEFILLTNTNINKNEWKPIWSNNPLYKELTFIEKPNLDVDQNLSIRQTDAELPITVPVIDASSPSYTTDEYGQHFPDQVLKHSNTTYWFSDDPNPKFLTLKLQAISTIKYIAVNFHKPDEYPQMYNVLYKTDKHDPQTGEPIIVQVAGGVQSVAADGLQIVVLDKPILTQEIYIDVISPIAAINYIILISNELSEEALDMFINSNVLEEQQKANT